MSVCLRYQNNSLWRKASEVVKVSKSGLFGKNLFTARRVWVYNVKNSYSSHVLTIKNTLVQIWGNERKPKIESHLWLAQPGCTGTQKTRRHFSRMSTVQRLRAWLGPGGDHVTCYWSMASWVMVTWEPSPWTKRHDWKHYIFATSLTSGNNCDDEFKHCWVFDNDWYSVDFINFPYQNVISVSLKVDANFHFRDYQFDHCEAITISSISRYAPERHL